MLSNTRRPLRRASRSGTRCLAVASNKESPLPSSSRHRHVIAIFVVAIASLACRAAAAHPHVFVDGHLQLNTGQDGKLVSVTNTWTFDAPFSAFATQGLDKNRDGHLSAAELKPLAHTNMDALSYYHFFTYVSRNGQQSKLGKPEHYYLTFVKKRLTLHFTLPIAPPIAFDANTEVEVFDPEYFVAFTFPKTDAVNIHGKPYGCSAHYHPPKQLDAAMVAKLAAVPASQHDLPPALKDAAAGLAHIFKVTCP